MIRKPRQDETEYYVPRIKHLGQIGNDFADIRSKFPQLEYRKVTVEDPDLTHQTYNFPEELGGKFTNITYGYIDGVVERTHPLADGKKIFFRLFRGLSDGETDLNPTDHAMDVVAHPEYYDLIWMVIQDMGLNIWPQRDVISFHNPMRRFLQPENVLRDFSRYVYCRRDYQSPYELN